MASGSHPLIISYRRILMGIAPLIMGTAVKVTRVEDPLSTLTFMKAVNVEEPGEQSPGVCSM